MAKLGRKSLIMNVFPLAPEIITDLWNRGIQNINFSIKDNNFQPKQCSFVSCSFPDSLNNFNTHYILISDSRDKYS